ncbi:hypothetical protein SOCE26_056900 [Sorangium cellulosum]|uniref:DUF2169 domain-containing protein n=1 Tax=Sorangium cellulosum TaxID=56 RepID=A0A2L0EY61_SORCE|nr:DUF2169 domain-containing protein [Sorangium cellulosum]AUX44226.1 hypothetical protein SOCE26_056900 [Sorangium cellulosum]
MVGGISVLGLSDVPVGWLVWHRPPSKPVLTVVCRATFVLRPGEAVLAGEQEPLAAVEQPYPGGASLGIYAPADLVPMKPHADVLLVGHAFAPGRQPVRSLFVRLAVGEVDKRIEVFCDRQFDLQGELREGPRFASMPLVYERAAGGPHTPNPIGVRPDVRDIYGRVTLPNLQPPGLEIASVSDPVAPIGFGPIARGWPSRRALLGPAAAARLPDSWQDQVLPGDLDPEHFQAAPRDQQVQALHADERITLENLHFQHARLVTRLPGLQPRAFVEGWGAPQGVAMRADTLWIDASRGLCTMTWRGQIRLEHAAQPARVLVAMEEPGPPLTWERVAQLRDVAVDATQQATLDAEAERRTVAVSLDMTPARASPLPFAAVQGPRAPHDSTPDGVGLPFRPPGAPRPPPMPMPPAPSDDGTGTIAMPAVPEMPAAAASSIPPASPAGPAVPVSSAPPPPAASPRAESPWAHRAASSSAPSQGELPTAPSPPIAAFASATATPLPVAPPLSPLPPLPITPPAKGAARTPPVSPAPRTATPDALHLVWFHPPCLARLRKDPRHAPVLEALDEQPLDEDLDDPTHAEATADLEDRREAFEILARGPISAEGAAAALARGVLDDGRLLQPIVLLAGELAFPFDELEALKAMLSAAAPHAGADPEARAVLDLVKEFLGTPGLPGAPLVAEGLEARIRETFEAHGLLPAGQLDALAARALLGGRHVQRRALFGGPHVRALFHGLAEGPIPTYLCEELAAKLPAAQRLRVRLLAHVHPAADEQETHPAALRAAALGIVSPSTVRR